MTSLHLTLVASLTLVLVVGCFDPRFKNGIACDQSGRCPAGQTCRTDGRCHTGDGPPIDAPKIPADAMPDAPDETPVGCQRDADCETPPNLCARPGTCDFASHTCVFGKVECSGMDDDCNVGVCNMATGDCVKQAAREAGACGAVLECGAFGACGGFSETDPCDSSGSQSRSCTRSACQAGACIGTGVTDTQNCTRNTEDMRCNDPTMTDCGGCLEASQSGCALDGHQSCTCTDFRCKSSTCQAFPTSCVNESHCSLKDVGDVCRRLTTLCPSNDPDVVCCSAAHTCSMHCCE
jgi:hypothetical protein